MKTMEKKSQQQYTENYICGKKCKGTKIYIRGLNQGEDGNQCMVTARDPENQRLQKGFPRDMARDDNA